MAAHEHLQDAESPEEDWLIRGNAYADAVAKWVNLHRPHQQQLVHRRYVEHKQKSLLATRAQQSFLLAMAEQELALPAERPDPGDESIQASNT